jgi:negative regulator of sigma E activity
VVGLKGVAVWRRKQTKWLRILVERAAAAAAAAAVVVVVVVVVGGAVFLGMMSSACRSGH